MSHKTWKPEAVLLLGSGMLLSLSWGGLLTFAAGKVFPGLNPVDERFIQFLIGTASLQGAALVMVHFFLRHHRVTWREFLGLHRPGLGGIVLRAVAVAALAMPMLLILASWCERIILLFQDQVELQPSVKVMELAVSPARRILFTFTSVVLAPVAEEMLFRGVLYTLIKEQGYPRLALLVSSVLFSAIHLNQLAFVPLIVLAVLFGLLYERTGSLLAPIVAHASFNAANLIYYAITHPAAG